MPKVSETYKQSATRKEYPPLLNAANLGSGPMSLHIKGAKSADVKGKMKILLSFEERPEEMVLNVTNSSVLSAKFGDDTDAWTGKEVRLFVTSVPYQNKLVPAVRIAD